MLMPASSAFELVGDVFSAMGKLIVLELRPDTAKRRVFKPARSHCGLLRARRPIRNVLFFKKAAELHLAAMATIVLPLDPGPFSRMNHVPRTTRDGNGSRVRHIVTYVPCERHQRCAFEKGYQLSYDLCPLAAAMSLSRCPVVSVGEPIRDVKSNEETVTQF